MSEDKVKSCPQCRKPIEKPVEKEIIFRMNGRVQTDKKEFCSVRCASHYQMGCEG